MSSFRTIELSDPTYESDGLRFLTVKTAHLQGRGDICVFVPKVKHHVEDLPIYILLHGVYGSAWSWALQGGAHHMAQQLMATGEIKPAIIAMPSDGLWGDGSGYQAHHQKRFDLWIVDDVPLAIRESIPQARQSSSLAIGGLSMGGFGALKLGAHYGEKFNAISAHSSITDLRQMPLFVEESMDEYAIDSELASVYSAIHAHRTTLPSLRFDCGMEDELLEPNRQLHQKLLSHQIAHTYDEFPGGHEWAYWQKHVEKTLRFFDGHV